MNWKKQAVAAMKDTFSARRVRQEKEDDELKANFISKSVS
jgi:hypothetical protein